MLYAHDFPMLAGGVPQVQGHTPTIRWQEITSNPGRRHPPIITVEHIMQPHGAGHLTVNETQKEELLIRGDFEAEILERWRKRIRIRHTQVVALHRLPPFL